VTGRLTRLLDPDRGSISDAEVYRKNLSELEGVFADTVAFAKTIRDGDPLVYSVSTYEEPQGDGALHCGLGVIYPGRVGEEYFQTRGHLHAWRPAGEVYVGLRGEGKMLLEPENGTGWQVEDLRAGSFVYVPGGMAHRTINVGPDPLVYLGIYPSAAGHDYTALKERNFRAVVVDQNNTPTAIERTEYLRLLLERRR
jgi:glucose-6-phosphate isomerase